jgi:transcriptional/translational regulatory protein YebC/TACO1
LSKHGGALGETNAVAFNFQRVGQITYPLAVGTSDAVLEAAIEAGADDCVSDADRHTITCGFDALFEVSKALETTLGEASSTKIEWQPLNTIVVDEEKLATLMKMIATLEDDDDVQNVYANFEVSEEVMAKLSQ